MGGCARTFALPGVTAGGGSAASSSLTARGAGGAGGVLRLLGLRVRSSGAGPASAGDDELEEEGEEGAEAAEPRWPCGCEECGAPVGAAAAGLAAGIEVDCADRFASASPRAFLPSLGALSAFASPLSSSGPSLRFCRTDALGDAKVGESAPRMGEGAPLVT